MDNIENNTNDSFEGKVIKEKGISTNSSVSTKREEAEETIVPEDDQKESDIPEIEEEVKEEVAEAAEEEIKEEAVETEVKEEVAEAAKASEEITVNTAAEIIEENAQPLAATVEEAQILFFIKSLKKSLFIKL